jgi:autotransporter-associated beta strand protein
MKRLRIFGAVIAILAAGATSAHAAIGYFDVNDTAADSGVADDNVYPWDTVATNLNWNPVADGTGSAVAWTNGDDAVFSAGGDGIGKRYGVNIAAATTATSALIDDGTVVINGGVLDTGAGVTTVDGSDATLEIASTLRLNSAGKLVLKNGGTLFQTNPGGAGSLISATKTLEIDTAGTVMYNLSSGCNCTIYGPTGTNTIAGTGGTTSNGGAGTLTKTGIGEFRYQNVGIANSTFAKLVVEDGLFRLGNAGATNVELGFGAAPLAFLADAITINGGAIGTSFGTTLHVNRGITIGSENAWFNNAGGTMTVPGVITGTGALNKDIDATLIKGSATASGRLNLTNAAGNTYSGGSNINAGTLFVSNTSGSGTGSGTVTLGGSATNQFGTLMGTGSIGGQTVLNDFGEVAPGGTTSTQNAGTLTLTGGLTANGSSVANRSILTFQLGATGNDLLVVPGANAVNFAGNTQLNVLANGVFTAGTYPLINYDTSFLGTLNTNFFVGTPGVDVPAGFLYSLVDNTVNTTIDLLVSLPGVPGDYNGNAVVDAADYVEYRKHLGEAYQLQNEVSGITPGQVTVEDLDAWQERFGNTGAGSGLGAGGGVPEPTAMVLLVLGLSALGVCRRRR